jgi:hypothetical protein
MKKPVEWKTEFQKRIADNVSCGRSFDINVLVQELVEDVQEDMRWWKPVKLKRIKYGIITRQEAESMKSKNLKVIRG